MSEQSRFAAYITLTFIWVLFVLLSTIFVFKKSKKKFSISRNAATFVRIVLIASTVSVWLLAQAFYSQTSSQVPCLMMQWSLFFGYPLFIFVVLCPAFVAILCNTVFPRIWAKNLPGSFSSGYDEVIDIRVIQPNKEVEMRKESLYENEITYYELESINQLWGYPIAIGSILAFFFVLLNLSGSISLSSNAAGIPIRDDLECISLLSDNAAILLAADFFLLVVICPLTLWKLWRISRNFLYVYKQNAHYVEGSESQMFLYTLVEQQNELVWLLLNSYFFGFVGLIYATIPFSVEVFENWSPFWFAAIIPMIACQLKLLYKKTLLPRFSLRDLTIRFPVFNSFISDDEEKREKPQVNISGLKPTEANLSLVMKDQTLRDQFKKFSILEHCMENVLFYEDFGELMARYDSYRVSMDEEEQYELNRSIRTVARSLYSTYISTDAPLELNISSFLKNEVKEVLNYKSASIDKLITALEAVAIEIKNLLLTDVFPRFLKSN